MYTVNDLLKYKGSEVYSVSPDTPTGEALGVMAQKGVGALLVLDGERVAGIISERDFVRRIASQGACDLKAPVKLFMTEQVYVVSPLQTIGECMELMTKAHVRHLPVVDGEKLVGLISIGDVVKQEIADRDSTIAGLENYITGRGYGQ